MTRSAPATAARSAVGAIRASVASRAAGVEATLGHRPVEVPGDPVATGHGPGEVRLVEGDLLADRGVDLGDPVAHQPGARRRRPARCSSLRPPARSPRAAGRPPRTDRARGRRPRRSVAVGASPASGAVRQRDRRSAREDRPDLRLGTGQPGAVAGAVVGRRRAVTRRWRSSAASSSGTPSPVAAVVTITSGRFGTRPVRARPDPPTPATGAATSIARSWAAVRCGPGPVALVDDDDVGHLEQAGLDRLDLVAHLGRLEDDRRVGRRRRPRPRSGRSRPSR